MVVGRRIGFSNSAMIRQGHAIIRWFSLDTIWGVLAVQLFLRNHLSKNFLIHMIGLSCGISLVYLLDRVRDCWCDFDVSYRHSIYRNRKKWVLVSIVVLMIPAGLYWLSLDGYQQAVLALCACLVMGHFWVLSFCWYRRVKDGIVATIFTVVMVGDFLLTDQSLLIWGATLVNLVSHRCIEFKSFSNMLALVWSSAVLYGGVCWMLSDCLSSVIWGAFILSQWGLVVHSFKRRYWYEWGELFYGLAFLVAYWML